MKKAIQFLKTNLNEIIYIVLFIGLFFIVFVPFVTLPIGNGETFYLSDVLSGNEIEGTSYSFCSSSILYFVMLALYFLSFVLEVISIILEKTNKGSKKLLYSLNISALLTLIIPTFLFLLAGSIIPLMVGIPIGDSNDGSTCVGFGVYLIIFAFIMILVIFSKVAEQNKYTIKEICETALMVALAVVLDQFAKIPIQANGGSISFSAVPLFILSIRYGGFKGFLASSVYFGLITCLLDGYGLQTFPFDYFIALAGYGFVGFFFNLVPMFTKNKEMKKWKTYLYYGIAIVIGGVCAMIVRYVGHMISGLILYPSLTLLENFIYQSTYVPGSVLISVATTLLLLPIILYINKIFPSDRKKKELAEEKAAQEIEDKSDKNE